MKAFRFRLDAALRWRATQLRLTQESVMRASEKVAADQRELMGVHSSLRNESAGLALAGSAAFFAWDAYLDRCRRRIQTLEAELRRGRQALALETQKMVEAHQKLRVLENLKAEGLSDWAKQLGRETEEFAGEAFLARLSGQARLAESAGAGRRPAFHEGAGPLHVPGRDARASLSSWCDQLRSPGTVQLKNNP